jgi:hypothetical protein
MEGRKDRKRLNRDARSVVHYVKICSVTKFFFRNIVADLLFAGGRVHFWICVNGALA